MIPLTVAEIAQAVGGEIVTGDANVTVSGTVEFDSRLIGPGGLFVAFDGEHVDGHDFADQAVRAGAAAVLSTRAVSAGVPCVVVSDQLDALGRLARLVADRLPELTIIGVTGSSGKTTTKDLIAQLLRRLGPTVAPPGSFNNELGLPHTVLKADQRTRFVVAEMGARGVGHLRYLCEIAPPTVGVVINVGSAHIGEFGSVEAIAQAKGELVEALPPGGVAVLNADDPRVAAMASRTRASVITVGESPDASVRAENVRLDERGRPSFTLVTAAGTVPVELAVSGRHQVGNTLAAAAVALSQGMAPAELGPALADLRVVSARRMDVFDRSDGVTVIDDSYNANPASMAAALRALTAIGDGRRRIAVLGYMAELGDQERDGHEEVGRLSAELATDHIVVVAANAAAIHDGARQVAEWGGESVLVTDQEAAVGWLREQLRAGDVVLVKASRYRTWAVADFLRDTAAGPSAAALDEVAAP